MNIMLFMRSSDVENLLVADLSGIITITEEIIKQIYGDYRNKSITVNMDLIIGSAHLYPDKDIRRT